MFTMDDMMAIVKPHNDKIVAEHKLDLAWQRIGALSGKNRNDFESGCNHAVEQALLILEELGAMDPVRRIQG